MISLIYTSCATRPFSAMDLFALLRDARAHNATAAVTGLLIYADQRFIQALEGAETTVDELYAHIARDARHTDVQVIDRAAIESREYADWSMGFAFPDSERLAEVLPGYDPLASLAHETIVSPETARLLIAALAADAEDEPTGEEPG